MSIRDSRKLASVLLAAGSVLGLYALLVIGLGALAHRSERALQAYPWRSEDYLRYMVPSLFDGRERRWMMISGPSEAREDLLHERIERAFPGLTVFQGGMSLGTIDDLIIAVEYLKETYGAEALPGSLLLGVTPRFVANISSIAESPLASSIDRYSPAFRVERSGEGPTLARKTAAEGAFGRIRFVAKHPSRFRAALCGIAGRQAQRLGMAGPNPWLMAAEEAPERISAREPANLIRMCASPYKYHHARQRTAEMVGQWLADTTSFWWKVHRWDPAADSSVVAARLRRLAELCRSNDIDLFVVNLPEHPLNRAGYSGGRYEQYMAIVRSALGVTPFLDLREMLPAEAFYDAGHARLRGAIAVTDSTIVFLRNTMTPAGPAGS